MNDFFKDFFNNRGLDNTTVLISALVVAGVVYLLRMLPIVVFKKKITNKFINSFLAYVPYGVLTSLIFPEVFYCTVSRGGDVAMSNIIAASAGLIVSLIMSYFNKGMTSIIVVSIVVTFTAAELLKFIPFIA